MAASCFVANELERQNLATTTTTTTTATEKRFQRCKQQSTPIAVLIAKGENPMMDMTNMQHATTTTSPNVGQALQQQHQHHHHHHQQQHLNLLTSHQFDQQQNIEPRLIQTAASTIAGASVNHSSIAIVGNGSNNTRNSNGNAIQKQQATICDQSAVSQQQQLYQHQQQQQHGAGPQAAYAQVRPGQSLHWQHRT